VRLALERSRRKKGEPKLSLHRSNKRRKQKLRRHCQRSREKIAAGLRKSRNHRKLLVERRDHANCQSQGATTAAWTSTPLALAGMLGALQTK